MLRQCVTTLIRTHRYAVAVLFFYLSIILRIVVYWLLYSKTSKTSKSNFCTILGWALLKIELGIVFKHPEVFAFRRPQKIEFVVFRVCFYTHYANFNANRINKLWTIFLISSLRFFFFFQSFAYFHKNKEKNEILKWVELLRLFNLL